MSEHKDKELYSDSLHRPMEFTDLVARILKDSVLLVIVCVCLFSVMAIVGYDANDPGWSHVGYQANVSNWMGLIGAYWSDIAFSFIGLSAWLAPLMILYPCLRLYCRKHVSLLDSLPFFMLRVIGGLVFVFNSSGLLSLHMSNATFNHPFTSGGIIGQALSEWMVSWFSIQGSSVVLWFSLLIGLTLYMELSWRELTIKLGAAILLVFSSIKGGGFAKKATANSHQDLQNDLNFPTQQDTVNHQIDTSNRLNFSSLSGQEAEPLVEPNKNISSNEESTTEIKPKVLSLLSTVFSKTESKIKQEARLDSLEKVSASVANKLINQDSLKEQLTPAEKLTATVAIDNSIDINLQPENDKDTSSLSGSPTIVPLSDPIESGKRPLKIIPLSETHCSTLHQEADLSRSQTAPLETSKVSIPSVNLLDPPELQTEIGYTEQQLEDMSRLLEIKLKDFGVVVEVVEVNPGPVITRFEIQPAPGVKSSKIANLAKDLARSLAVMSVRVVEVIPGKSVMGIEIPNINRKMVRLSEVLTSPVYQDAASALTLALGNDIAGNPVVANLAKMPHLLVAGTTGSGKSVGVNAMLLSLLFKAGPEDVRLMLVDPKMLELSIYEGIPHLLTPVITDMKEAAGGLRWCVAEMERRYKLMSKMGVRNLDGFNDKVKNAINQGEPLLDPLWDPQEYGEHPGAPAPQLSTLPYIVVVIDEFADMMMIVGKKVEELIARIAQKARAAGIHLILATQRPSVDVITGLIKANVPTRIAFQVSSKIDSRTILDQGGADNLLGNGDMLYLPAGTSVPSRVHGAFVGDDEVHRAVEAWKKIAKPEFITLQVSEEGALGSNGNLFEDDEQDLLYDEAVAFITTTRKVSISSVQRKFKIGYNRAARIVESMEAAGVITTASTNGQREVIAPAPPPRG